MLSEGAVYEAAPTSFLDSPCLSARSTEI
jgi:hypothetical protein